MSSRRAFTRRSLAAFLPLALVATLLSTDALFGQGDDAETPEIVPVSTLLLPSASVAVLGDGFLAAPHIAPLHTTDCVRSSDGPVERAARNTADTVIAVQNESCADASLLSIGREQVTNVDPGTDVVIIGGVGLEFDWPALAAACLGIETRSADGCQNVASVARSNAANSFFSWRSLIQQAHRRAPGANLVIVAPPAPVSNAPLHLGSTCCDPSADGHGQVRAVFDTAGSLRRAVVESMADLPIVLVETDEAFAGHRIDADEPWLSSDSIAPGTPTRRGATAMADLLDVLMPVGDAPAAPASDPSEIVLLLGTTQADRASLTAVSDAADSWLGAFEQSNVRPSVAVVPIATSAPVPPTTTTTTTVPPDDDRPIGDDSAPVELPAETPVNEAAEDEAVEAETAEDPADQLVERDVAPRALQVDDPARYATTADELEQAIAELTTAPGVTSIADLSIAIRQANALFSPTVDRHSLIVRAVNLDVANASTSALTSLRAAIAETSGAVTIIVTNLDDATTLSRALRTSDTVVDVSNNQRLGVSLPFPEPAATLESVSVPDTDATLSRLMNVAAQVDTVRPADATVNWYYDGDLIATGQKTTIDPLLLGVGAHRLDVIVTTETERVDGAFQVRVSADGDGRIDDSCESVFDPFGIDTDQDGLGDTCDSDADDDGLPDAIDPCPTTATDNLGDIDLDGRPNHCDADDFDGPRADVDGDGYPDLVDNCPTVSQVNQFDADHDGIGNACETNTNPTCTITGTSGNDELRGTDGPDVICGLGGDDVISGFGGNDLILAGPGDDRVFGGNGDDRVFGGNGRDQLHGQGGDDALFGEAGNDVLRGGFGRDLISGGRGADDVDGSSGADTIFGGRGADTLRGGNGADTISGERGNDSIFGENGDDLLTGGPGVDSVRAGRGNDQLVDVESIDFVRGGTGQDLIDNTPLRVT